MWVDALSASLTPVIALLAGYVAVRQWLTARNRLKLDLFDRRIAVYEEVRSCIGEAVRTGVVTDEIIVRVARAEGSAKWLFGAAVAGHISESIYEPMVDLQCTRKLLPDATGPERADLAKKSNQGMKHLVNQFIALDKVMGPFLTLQH